MALGGVPAAEELFAGVDEVFGCNVETWAVFSGRGGGNIARAHNRNGDCDSKDGGLVLLRWFRC